MRHILFEESPTGDYNIAVLVKSSSFNKQELINNYITPMEQRGVNKQEMIAFTLEAEPGKKTPSVAFIKTYLQSLLPALEDIAVKYLYVCDGNYFKTLTGQTKAEPHYGYVLPCKIKGYEHMSVVLGLNYQALIYNPDLQAKLDLSLHTLASHGAGTYQAIGTGIIHSAQYPESLQDIAQALESLHQYESLTCDIEAFSLRFNEAGIGTIAFAWDKHNGIAFAVDYKQVVRADGTMDSKAPEESWASHYGYQVNNIEVKRLLKQFFTDYKGQITWHNGVYDIKIIIYELWMKALNENLPTL